MIFLQIKWTDFMQNFLFFLAELLLWSDTISLAAHQHLPISLTSPPPDMIVKNKNDKKGRNN